MGPSSQAEGCSWQGSSATHSVLSQQAISRWTWEPRKWCPLFPCPGPHSCPWSPVLHWSDPTRKLGAQHIRPLTQADMEQKAATVSM